jgi:hypothetical protein
MELVEADYNFYKEIIPKPYHVFAQADFNDLNKNKCEKVYFLLFKTSKYKLGLIGGIKENIFFSPFSSPFGGLTFIHQDIKINDIEETLKILEIWAKSNKIKKISFTIPPSFYQKKFIAKQINSLYRFNYEIKNIDLNYYFEIQNFDENYIDQLWYSARKALKNAFENSLYLKKCTEKSDIKLAYDIIKENRTAKGFPLRMAFEDILLTDFLIKKDFFIVYTKDRTAIASSIIYYISDETVQVVYWGNLTEYSHLKPMNFLSYKLFEYYSNMHVKYIDIGPSTENSIPNYGLCEFKESIGCNICPKYTFIKIL